MECDRREFSSFDIYINLFSLIILRVFHSRSLRHRERQRRLEWRMNERGSKESCRISHSEESHFTKHANISKPSQR